MTLQKFYKIKIRQNVFRQLLFTDKNICIAIIIGVALSTQLLFRSIDLEYRILFGLVLLSSIGFIASLRIDEQSLYLLLPRIVRYIFRRHHVRF